MNNSYRMVVGVDGSEGGQRALRWAVREAAGRGGTVHAVTAYTFDALDASDIRGPDAHRSSVEEVLAEQVAHAVADCPGATVTTQVSFGTAPDVLVDAARRADLLVIGSHGHGRLFHAVLGSVAEACTRAAPCPVVVVPVPHTEKAPDDSQPSGIPSAIL
ncbi:MAG: universal stress protein [Micromonosporaceae bacterium]|nr:universal stress protein [Micromonosporaceae bacterium]